MLASIAMLAAAAGEAAQQASEGGLPQLNPHTFSPQLFWLALTFVVLLFAMSKIALPRVGEVINERADRIQRDIDAAARLKAETDRALAEYEKALADARANASGIAKETRDKIATETDAEKARAEVEVNAKIQEAEMRIAGTKAKALSAVTDIAADTAKAVVAKLVGQDVSLDEVKKVLQ
jgi:F-type H+-transporting ATPase subunit b